MWKKREGEKKEKKDRGTKSEERLSSQDHYQDHDR